MCEQNQEEKIFICKFCGATSTGTTKMVTRKDDDEIAICGKCILACEALLRDEDEENEKFDRIPHRQRPKPGDKLRSITRIPKGWRIYNVELFEKAPYVRACSSNGKKGADFALPLPLAVWMMSNDDKLDLEKLRAGIIDRISMAVWSTINDCK